MNKQRDRHVHMDKIYKLQATDRQTALTLKLMYILTWNQDTVGKVRTIQIKKYEFQ